MTKQPFSNEKHDKRISLIAAIICLVTAIIGLITAFFNKANEGKAITPPYWLIFYISAFLIFIIVAIYFFVRARREKNTRLAIEQHLKEAMLTIENIPIHAVNVEHLYRRFQNNNFKLKSTTNMVTFDKSDVIIEFESKGVKIEDEGIGYLYNISSDNHRTLDDLNCYCFDLENDPDRQHKLKPILKSSDGPLKQVLAPFLRRVNKHDPFHVYIRWESAGSIKLGVDYHGCTLSHANNDFRASQTIILNFKNFFPKWIRVYEVSDGAAVPIKVLPVNKQEKGIVTYTDEYQDISLNKKIIYFFDR